MEERENRAKSDEIAPHEAPLAALPRPHGRDVVPRPPAVDFRLTARVSRALGWEPQ